MLHENAAVVTCAAAGILALAWFAHRSAAARVAPGTHTKASASRSTQCTEQQLLTQACVCGDTSVVRELRQSGASCNTEDDNGRLPLVVAASNGQADVVELLLEASVNIDALDAGGGGGSALLCACLRGHLEVVQLLVKHGASRDAHKPGYWGALDLDVTVEMELQELRRSVAERGQQPWNPSVEAIESVLLWLRANPAPDSPTSIATDTTLLRVAFVGCGNIAKYHASAALATRRVAITALIDPKRASRRAIAELIPQEFGWHRAAAAPGFYNIDGIPEFASLADALAADPDGRLFEAVDIMVPSFLVEGIDMHESVTLEALAAQRHVLLEKPVTVTPAAAERIASFHQTAAKSRVVAVAENAQFWPEVLAAHACLQRGDIGELLSVHAKFWESATGEWAGDYAEGSWRCDPTKLPAASFTYDGASHWIRPLRMWLGEVTSVVGCCGTALTHMAGVSMSQHLLRFASGKVAVFESMLAPRAISDQPFFRLQGTLGEIVIEGFDGGCTLHTLDSSGAKVVRELCREGWDAGYVGEYRDFAAAVLGGTPTAGPLSEALADLRVVRALVEGAEPEGGTSTGWIEVL